MRQYHNEQYEKRIVFMLRHGGFVKNEAPVSLLAAGKTNDFLHRNNAVFRCDAPGCWSVCVQAGRHLEPNDTCDTLRFEIRPRSNDFYYYSHLSEAAFDGWRIVKGDSPGVWKAIEIPMDTFASSPAVRTITVEIQAIEKYVEFFLIPRYNPPEIRLRLTGNKGVLFTEPENTDLWDYGPVQRVVSTKPLAVSSPPDLKIRLWEVRNGGERVLSDNVPFPACDSPSPINPDNTITTYFYY